jgi:tetraacyldisaccharide 4'-kinase
VPVVSNPNRYEGVAQLLAAPGGKPDVVILDDGFQHRRLQRELDIVLVDVTQNPFEDRVLPAGWLREPVENLARASCVVLTRVDQVAGSTTSAIRDRVERLTGAPPIAETRHAWAPELNALINERETTKPVAWLRGKTALVACALGNPASFVNQVRSAGATVAKEILLRDHARFTEPQVQRILEAARGVDLVICTSKDWTKLRRVGANRWPCPVVRPIVQIEVLTGREELARRIEAAAAPKQRRRAQERPSEERPSDAA